MNDTNKMPDEFDRKEGSLHGLPDVLHTKPSTVEVLQPFGVSRDVWIVRTYRMPAEGDWLFLTRFSGGTTERMLIPPRIAETISRQRDQLTSKGRSKAAKAVAADRKERGLQPGFMKPRIVK